MRIPEQLASTLTKYRGFGGAEWRTTLFAVRVPKQLGTASVCVRPNQAKCMQRHKRISPRVSVLACCMRQTLYAVSSIEYQSLSMDTASVCVKPASLASFNPFPRCPRVSVLEYGYSICRVSRVRPQSSYEASRCEEPRLVGFNQ